MGQSSGWRGQLGLSVPLMGECLLGSKVLVHVPLFESGSSGVSPVEAVGMLDGVGGGPGREDRLEEGAEAAAPTLGPVT